MNAAEAPVFGDADWNQYRARVAAALTDVEADMQQRGYGLSREGLTLEVAGRLSLGVATREDFQVLEALVKALRPLAREAVRATREDHGGQFALLLL
ncbi:hypothetical protein GCM10023172_01150 [Hymenobacter ginsengisoli]|uniref:Uncharacterized protein n=1 Tax=Hymenobacter ginsengisoli TaxID=1051626 RepID=A0ABP8PXM7_9BACT|nr:MULTISPECIES: hypothetical protein [unclassified Hymenobacter]MBO2033513.1 hypothetical protein [Hymenobacter sp. BT559]